MESEQKNATLSTLKTSKFVQLSDLLKTFVLSNTNGKRHYRNGTQEEAVANFVHIGIFKESYCIPETSIEKLFTLYNALDKENIAQLNLAEIQAPVSGLVLDFDIYQTDKTQVDAMIFNSVLITVFSEIREIIQMDEQITTQALILTKPKVRRADPIDDEKTYKDGFHLIIPGIKLPKAIKGILINRLATPEALGKMFGDLSRVPDSKISEIMDPGSKRFPTLLVGSGNGIKQPYLPTHIYSITIPEFNTIYIRNDEMPENPAYEFSVNYEKEGGLVKTEYPVKATVMKIIPTKEKKATTKSKDIYVDEYMSNPELREISELVGLIGVSRCEVYEEWFVIITVLAYLGPEFHSIALEFSGIRKKGVRTDFQAKWDEAINGTSYSYTVNNLMYYARKDNPVGFDNYMRKSISGQIKAFIFDKNLGGTIDHHQIAQLLVTALGDKYVYSQSKLDKKKLALFEFVTAKDNIQHGQIYKWVEYSYSDIPKLVSDYMSVKLPEYFGSVIEEIRKISQTKEDDVILQKHYTNCIKRLVFANSRLKNHGFKVSTYKEFVTTKQNISLSSSFDENGFALGVGNGILLLPKIKGEIPKFIAEFNNLKVSKYTRVDYRQLDAPGHMDKMFRFFTIIWEMFPDTEKDAFVFLLFYISLGLVHTDKQPLLFMLLGVGANGKSVILAILQLVLGINTEDDHGYSAKIPISVLTSDENSSSSASPDLYMIKGARMVLASESKPGQILNDGKMKGMIGSESMSCRTLFKGQENFMPGATWLGGNNHEFIVNTVDDGTWRRLLTLYLKNKFVDNPDPSQPLQKKKDPNIELVEKNDPEFQSGALSVLSIFYTILIEDFGGNIKNIRSETVERETAEYRNRQDSYNRFITEKVVVSEGYSTPLTEITGLYCLWYNDNIEITRHNRSHVTTCFESSKIGKYIETEINGTKSLLHCRVISSDDPIREGETFLVPPRKPRKKSKKPKTSPSARKVFDKFIKRYREIIKEYTP